MTPRRVRLPDAIVPSRLMAEPPNSRLSRSRDDLSENEPRTRGKIA